MMREEEPTNLGLVGLMFPGLKPAMRAAASGFMSIGDWGPIDMAEKSCSNIIS